MDEPIEPVSEYDLASGSTLSLSLPQVTLHPTQCFTVDHFSVTEVSTGLAPSTDVLTVTPSSVEISSDDRSLEGLHEFTIQAELANGEQVQSHNFQVDMIDSCWSSKIVQSQEI